jgi:hypothetical protein
MANIRLKVEISINRIVKYKGKAFDFINPPHECKISQQIKNIKIVIGAWQLPLNDFV